MKECRSFLTAVAQSDQPGLRFVPLKKRNWRWPLGEDANLLGAARVWPSTGSGKVTGELSSRGGYEKCRGEESHGEKRFAG